MVLKLYPMQRWGRARCTCSLCQSLFQVGRWAPNLITTRFLVKKCLRCSQSPGSSNGPQELIGSKEVTFLKLGGSSNKKTHGSKHFGQQRDHGSQDIKRQDKLVIHLWAFNLAFKAATPGGSKVPSKLETSLVGKVSPRAVLSPQSFLLCTGELSNSIPFILLLFF